MILKKLCLGIIVVIGIVSCELSNKMKDISNSTDWNEKALQFNNIGEVDSATFYLKKSIKICHGSNLGTLLRNLAVIYDDNSEIDSAIHYYNRAAEIHQHGNYYYFINKSSVDLLNENIDAAKLKAEAAFRLNPEFGEANNLISLINLGLYGDEYLNLDTALKHAKLALDADLDHSGESSFLVGLCQFKLEKFEDALKLFDASQKKASSSYTLMHIGYCQFQIGEDSKGKETLTKVIEMDSNFEFEVNDYLLSNGFSLDETEEDEVDE